MTKLFDLNGGVEISPLKETDGTYIVSTDANGNPVTSGFVTIGTLVEHINSLRPRKYRGALVSVNGEPTFTSSVGGQVLWDTSVYDTDGIWSNSSSTRLTVPEGVTLVRLKTLIFWSAIPAPATGSVSVSITKNGNNNPNSYPGAGGTRVNSSDTTLRVSGSTATVPVQGGDYFQVRLVQTSGLELSLLPNTWFSMELLEWE